MPRRRVPSLIAVASLVAATLVGVAPAQAAGVWQPPVDPTYKWQWQITGTVDTNVTPAAMFDIDEQDAVPTTQTVTSGLGKSTWSKGPNATAIATLHGKNKIVICYLDSGAWESYRPDASLFPASVKGNSTGWSGERWLDIRSPAWPKFALLIWARMDLAKKIGCDGIEPIRTTRSATTPASRSLSPIRRPGISRLPGKPTSAACPSARRTGSRPLTRTPPPPSIGTSTKSATSTRSATRCNHSSLPTSSC